ASARRANEPDDASPVLGLAGDLAARHERQLGHLRVAPAANQRVREVDGGRTDVDDGLARACLGLRDVAHGELLGPARLLDADRLPGLTSPDASGFRPPEPGSRRRLTTLAAGCVALGAWPYHAYCPARLALASFASAAPRKRVTANGP